MTTKTFGQLYIETRGGPITYQGMEVYPSHKIRTSVPIALEVIFVRVDDSVRQALRVAVDSGAIMVNGQTFTDVILWSDTAAPRQLLHIRPSAGECRVTVWNAWDYGGMQAWIGNCGVVKVAIPDGVRLRCSNGIGAPNFDDFVVDLHARSESP